MGTKRPRKSLKRGEPPWIFLTAALWYPPIACAFWVYVLTRLIRGTSAMLGSDTAA